MQKTMFGGAIDFLRFLLRTRHLTPDHPPNYEYLFFFFFFFFFFLGGKGLWSTVRMRPLQRPFYAYVISRHGQILGNCHFHPAYLGERRKRESTETIDQGGIMLDVHVQSTCEKTVV